MVCVLVIKNQISVRIFHSALEAAAAEAGRAAEEALTQLTQLSEAATRSQARVEEEEQARMLVERDLESALKRLEEEECV